MKVKVKKHIPAGIDRELLEKVVNVAWRFDPYNGLFKEELTDQYIAAFQEKDGMKNIILDLVEMLNTALD